MNIGIDATCWWNNRGFGRFTRELLTALFKLDSSHNFILFTDQPLSQLVGERGVTVVEVKTSRPTTEAAVADNNRSPIDMLRMYRAVAGSKIDVMFFPAVYSWYPVPLNLPTMVTVHDAIAEHYPKLIFPNWRSRFFWTLKVKGAIWSCQRLLTVSQAAKEEIEEYIGVNSSLIDVAGEAPSPEFFPVTETSIHEASRKRAGLPIDAPLIVFVGGLAPHKNLHGLLDGFEIALEKNSTAKVHLALVGDLAGAGFYSNYESLLDRVQSSVFLRDRVHFTGYVSDEDLIALYSSALAVAMPSYSEGFGLPAVEAMACSAPILSSDKGSLPEVVGDAGVYFDPFDVMSIAAAIIAVVQDDELRERLSCNAVVRAGRFTWENAARLTLKYLEDMSGPKPRIYNG